MDFRHLARNVEGLARIVDGLAKEHAQTRGMVHTLLGTVTHNPRTGQSRGILGRLKWLILGK